MLKQFAPSAVTPPSPKNTAWIARATEIARMEAQGPSTIAATPIPTACPVVPPGNGKLNIITTKEKAANNEMSGNRRACRADSTRLVRYTKMALRRLPTWHRWRDSGIHREYASPTEPAGTTGSIARKLRSCDQSRMPLFRYLSASADFQDCAGDIRRRRREQPCDSLCDFFRLPRPAHRNRGRDPSRPVRFAGGSMQIGFDQPRRHRIHADTFLRHFTRQPDSKSIHGAFRSGIVDPFARAARARG